MPRDKKEALVSVQFGHPCLSWAAILCVTWSRQSRHVISMPGLGWQERGGPRVLQDDDKQFQHQTQVATQTQTERNPVMNTNPMCRIFYTPSCDWLKNLGYIGVEFTLQLTFGADTVLWRQWLGLLRARPKKIKQSNIFGFSGCRFQLKSTCRLRKIEFCFETFLGWPHAQEIIYSANW